MISEVEFFTEILEDFLCLDNQLNENELWKFNSIIKLMQTSDEFEDEGIIAEGLKIIINLSKFIECGEIFDSYELESQYVCDLSKPEKTLLRSILKAEFT